ncbi:RNA polymerase sigma factor SigJ [Cohnella fermenti]|uniref:Sigma-70 family RNA polymerase sigma factor n=1 Tax=Cohnella fermenti TaxID=2565925 RepID=A0A4S4BUN2_9BACL|nr:RNA polymerase sigma factor SigJ [Cohnella fermenti]THF78817.1 sigma-70 family RNA polymerase sigma factor [Cohnella fermenti]
MKELFEQYRRLLFTLAYQLTGSAADAEDVVQDVFVKAHGIAPERLAEPKAYLCKMVTNRCLDLHRSARKRRESYFGTWLPEPILVSEDEAFESVITRSLLSYAMLVLLERLSPAERAVFVLREALALPFADIALLLDKSEAACRKLMSRARARMGIAPDEAVRTEEADEAWLQAFLAELASGNAENVARLLAPDIAIISDGGGKASAAVRPIETPERAAAFLLGLAGKAARDPSASRIELAAVNGQIGVLVRSDDGLDTVVLPHAENGLAKRFYFIRNPDKLAPIAAGLR